MGGVVLHRRLIMPRKMGEGGVGGEVVHKYIFQYSEDCKSEHFLQLWGDINFWKKRKKALTSLKNYQRVFP